MSEAVIEFTYKDFKHYIDAIYREIKFQRDVDSAVASYNRASHNDAEMYMPSLVTEVIDLLSTVTNDNSDWISYWIFELDCGENYKEGDVEDENGRVVPLRTAKDLWMVLTGEEPAEDDAR